MMKYIEALITHLESMSEETKVQVCNIIIRENEVNKPMFCEDIACKDCPFSPSPVKHDFSEIKTFINLLT